MGAEWNQAPSWSSVQFLREVLDQHSKVRDYGQGADPQLWWVERHGMERVEFYFQDVYTLGLADYAFIRNAHPEIRCIVTASSWNWYSSEARTQASQDGVALFNVGGLMGALNRSGEQFYRYLPRN